MSPKSHLSLKLIEVGLLLLATGRIPINTETRIWKQQICLVTGQQEFDHPSKEDGNPCYALNSFVNYYLGYFEITLTGLELLETQQKNVSILNDIV